MSKLPKYFVVNGRIPEWGVSPHISTAVPIAASGAEIKSTRGVSESMYTVLSSRLNELKDKKAFTANDVAKLRTIFTQSRQGPTSAGKFYRATTGPRRGTIAPGNASRTSTVTVNRVRSGPTAARRSSTSRAQAARKRS